MKRFLPEKIILWVYVVVMGTVFPLFMTNYYYNIQKSKSLFFVFLTFAVLLITVVITAIRFGLDHFSENLKKPLPVFLACFFGVISLSTFFSPFHDVAFAGNGGRFIGFIFLTAVLIAAALPVLVPIRGRFIHLFYLSAGLAAAAIGIFNFLGADLFGLVSAVPERLRGQYLSTIGYSGFFAEYLSLTALLGISAFTLTKERFILPVLFVIDTALLIANSSGALIAVFVSLLVFPLLFRKEEDWFLSFITALFPLPFGCAAARFLFSYGQSPVTPDGLTAVLLSNYFAPGLFILLLLLFGFLYVRKRKQGTGPRKKNSAVVIYGWILAAAFSAFLLFAVLSNTGVLPENRLTITDSSFGYRGYIWTRSLRLFAHAPFMRKVFGYGPDTLKSLYAQSLGQEMTAVTGQVYDSAHSFFLQYLLTTGLAGMISLTGIIVSLLIPAVKSCAKSRLIFLSALTVLLVQLFYMADQPMVTPFLYLFLGLSASDPPEEAEEMNPEEVNPT